MSAARTAQVKAMHEKRAIAASTTNSSASPATANVPDGGAVPEDTARIQMLQQTVTELQTALQIQQDLVAQLTQNLASEKEQNRMLLAKADAEKEHSKQLYKVMRVEKRARQRGKARKASMEEQVKLLKSAAVRMSMNLKEATGNASKAIDALLTIKKENTTLRSELSRSLQLYMSDLAAAKKKLNVAGEKMKEYKGQAAKFKKRCDRAAVVQANALKRATDRLKKEKSIHNLLHKGVYTEKTRALIKLLVQAGCSQAYVGEVIHEVFRTAGISVRGNVSRRTVSRVILEGYVAAKIQLGFEMDKADSMTFGADGTMHRDINYNARHVHLKTESYGGEGSNATKQSTRLLGVHSALDGSSEESVKAWKELLGGIADIYNQSPLGKRTGHLLRVVDIFVKLAGMHSDHCAKEKKDYHLMEKEKTQATYQALGEDAILEKTNQELLPDFQNAREQMINKAGGEEKWDALTTEEQAEHEAKMMEDLTIELGKESFEMLSSDEKRIFKLFVWAGCGCHKDLNTVRGGNTAMMAWWEENDQPGPVLLANRDNAAVLKDHLQDCDVLTPAQERALEMTTRGGIKTAKLAGEIFNNKNDKKGHHDSFRWWWKTNFNETVTFPPTSNNRFQSHCNAAALMIQHLPRFLTYLEYAKQKKKTMRFSHMEQNLWNALHCSATKTELAVLALYAQAISHPYVKRIRGSEAQKISMLDLGDYHKSVFKHMKKIIQRPSLLLGPRASYKTGALDGQCWEAEGVFAAIQRLAPELPHLSPVLVAFFKGAAETWKRFTSEFAPGGLIDEATPSERDLAWMPPTNDVNEGALGAFRVLLRRQPQLSELHYNAQAMFKHNETQAFMEAKFQPEDYKFIHEMARLIDSQGLEPKRKKALVQHMQAKNNKRMAIKEMRRQNAAKKAARISAVKIIKNKEEVKGLKGEKLKDCLIAYRQWKAPLPDSIKARSPVAAIREALQACVDAYNNGKWKPEIPSEIDLDNEEMDSGEESDLEEDASSWEDE